MRLIKDVNAKVYNSAFEVVLIDEQGKEIDFFNENNEKISLNELIDMQMEEVELFTDANGNKKDKRFSLSVDDVNLSISDYAYQVATCGDKSKIAICGEHLSVASSGNNSCIIIKGEYASTVSSGPDSIISTSDDNSNIASSGHSTQIFSRGNSSKISLSGYKTITLSSGEHVHISASGDEAKIITKGIYPCIAISGSRSFVTIDKESEFSQLAISGDGSMFNVNGCNSKVSSSGDFTKAYINGANSVAFLCGDNSVVKAVNGTWISLCEYSNEETGYMPVFALSGQIGNKDYLDCNGDVLNEHVTYKLLNKQFTPVKEDEIL